MKIGRVNQYLVLIGLILILEFGWFLYAQGSSSDFWQFLMDRREGAGQTQPDRKATCYYKANDQELLVTRKAHGQTDQKKYLLNQYIKSYFGGQNAIIETKQVISTFNCINGEYLTFDAIKRDKSITQVLFSESGRNVAVVTQDANLQNNVHVFTFMVDKEQSAWDKNFGPKQQGLKGKLNFIALKGESLVVILGENTQKQVHTYNFRVSHKNNPYNEFSKTNQPLIVLGELQKQSFFDDLGKKFTFTIEKYGKKTTYTHNFSCKVGECSWDMAQ